MKVFISWSGGLSHSVALVLRDWLPKVIQSVEPYVSSEDIDKGTRWSIDVAVELANSYYGILCVTKDNQTAPWLNFEAGALSRLMEEARVSPFLLNLKKSEVSGPLQQFQLTTPDKSDVKKLVYSIKVADKDCRLTDPQFDDVFDMWWPKLEQPLQSLTKDNEKTQTTSKTTSAPDADKKHDAADDIMEEILQLSRQQSRTLASQERILVDVLERGGSRIQNFSHPVFRDITRSWQEIDNAISSGESLEKINQSPAFQRMNAAVGYIRRSMPSRNLNALASIAQDSGSED